MSTGGSGARVTGHGSDAGGLETRGDRVGNGYVLNGVKWHVTGFNRADVIVFQAKMDDGQHGLFYVDRDAAAVKLHAE